MRYFLLICAVVVSQSVLAADKKPLFAEFIVEKRIRTQIKKPQEAGFTNNGRRIVNVTTNTLGAIGTDKNESFHWRKPIWTPSKGLINEPKEWQEGESVITSSDGWEVTNRSEPRPFNWQIWLVPVLTLISAYAGGKISGKKKIK